jgi:hypothetical protein
MMLAEIKESDKRIASLDMETWECVMDALPAVDREPELPYIHRVKEGYPVLNICATVLNIALLQCGARVKESCNQK